MISSIQHYVFCPRRWALVHLEQQWSENYFTVDGDIFHEKAHDGGSFEKRKNTIISRGIPVSSRELGISGVCDIVEFKENPNGIAISGRPGRYDVYPVEYKRGKTKDVAAYQYQVVAQAMCLEEMLCCHIPVAYLYYGASKRRQEVLVDESSRGAVRDVVAKMHQAFARGTTPPPKKRKACHSCSLVHQCLPQLEGSLATRDYLSKLISGGV